MLENKKINIEELKKASGGRFTKECSDWLTRNYDTIILRSSNVALESDAVLKIYDLQFSDDLQTTDDLKKALKDIGLNCDDLN